MIDPRRVFNKVYIIPDWVRGHFIQWQLDPFFKGVRPYNFSLEISEDAGFSEIFASKENLGEVFFAVDDTKLKQSWKPSYYYRVVLNTGDGKKYNSIPVVFGQTNHEPNRYAMAADIIRKEILLCRYAGGPGWLLRRKTYGTKGSKTSKNIDPISGVPIADNVDEDYGVGVDDGYFSPVACVYYNDSGTQDKQLDPGGIGVKESYGAVIRLPGYPIIEVRDIICDAEDGYRYSVQAKQSKVFPGTNIIITQKASVNLIPPSDTIYSIPIPLAVPV